MQTLQSPTRPARRRTPAERRCSFCGKADHQVEQMIASKNNVHICNECVSLCGEIIAERRAKGTSA